MPSCKTLQGENRKNVGNPGLARLSGAYRDRLCGRTDRRTCANEYAGVGNSLPSNNLWQIGIPNKRFYRGLPDKTHRESAGNGVLPIIYTHFSSCVLQVKSNGTF